MQLDKDALVNDIGRYIASDAKVNDGPWDRYALIAHYAGNTCTLSGFRYTDDGGRDAATPDTDMLLPLLRQLREATRIDGKAPWGACVVQIVKASRRIGIDFEYDAPERWDITPTTLDEVAEHARPV